MTPKKWNHDALELLLAFFVFIAYFCVMFYMVVQYKHDKELMRGLSALNFKIGCAAPAVGLFLSKFSSKIPSKWQDLYHILLQYILGMGGIIAMSALLWIVVFMGMAEKP